MIVWTCLCGFKTVDARESFLHRDGSPEHHISPERYVLEPVSGIDRELADRDGLLKGDRTVVSNEKQLYILPRRK